MMRRKRDIETNLIETTKVTCTVHKQSLEDGKQSDLKEAQMEEEDVFNEFEVQNEYLVLFWCATIFYNLLVHIRQLY